MNFVLGYQLKLAKPQTGRQKQTNYSPGVISETSHLTSLHYRDLA